MILFELINFQVNKKGASLPLTETMKGKINISRIGVRGGRKK